jgi:hypothetical protein
LPLALGIVARPGDGTVERTFRAFVDRGVAIDRVAAFDPRRHTTTPAHLAELREVLASVGSAPPAGGGSCGYLYQLALDGTPGGSDFVEYPINPQVHERDDASVLGTVRSLAATVATAAELAGSVPVHVAPATLRARFNPDLADAEPNGEVPLAERYDARQGALLAAAWSIGSLAALAGAGAASVAFHETAGAGGLVAGPDPAGRAASLPVGSTLPVGAAIAAIAGAGGRTLRAVGAPDDLGVLALDQGEGVRVLIANLRLRARDVTVELPVAPNRVRVSSLVAHGADPWTSPVEAMAARRTVIGVGPGAVVRLDVDTEGR